MKKNLIKLSLPILIFSLSCQPNATKKEQARATNDLSIIVPFNQNPFAGSQNFSNNLHGALNAMNIKTGAKLVPDQVWALSQCQCAPGFAGAYFKNLISSRGVLPQPLVPDIREEIRNNDLLKALFKMPPGGLKSIATLFAGFFTGDDSIAEKVKDGVDEKITKALPTAQSNKSLNYKFELFPVPNGSISQIGAPAPKDFNMIDQSAKWAFVFAQPNLWRNMQPLPPYKDHGIQLVTSALSLAEWSYIYGLDKSEDQKTTYGGLSFNIAQGKKSDLGSYDPRLLKAPQDTRVASGRYAINFQNAKAVDLAINIREQWLRNADDVSLQEQAMFWTSSAMAFGKLKPSQRKQPSVFAPQTGMFPDDVHQLPLITLSSMGELLDGRFINKDSRQIYRFAQIDGTSDQNRHHNADPLSLVRLARALSTWVFELQSAPMERLSPDTTNSIMNGQGDLKDALRLSVQAIFKDHLQFDVGGIKLVTAPNNHNPPPVELSAEILATLSEIDQTSLASPNQNVQTDFRKKIIALFHWFARVQLNPLTQSSQLSPQAAVWIYTALTKFANYPPNTIHAPWLKDALSQAQTAVNRWDQESRNGL